MVWPQANRSHEIQRVNKMAKKSPTNQSEKLLEEKLVPAKAGSGNSSKPATVTTIRRSNASA